MLAALLPLCLLARLTHLDDENYEEFFEAKRALIVLFHAEDAEAKTAFEAAAERALGAWPVLSFGVFDHAASDETLEHFGLTRLPAVLVHSKDLQRRHEGLNTAEMVALIEELVRARPSELESDEELRAFVGRAEAVLVTLGQNATDFDEGLAALALHHHSLPFARTRNTRFRHPDHPDTSAYTLSVYRAHGRKHHTVSAEEFLPHTFSLFVQKHSAPSVIELGPDSAPELLAGHSSFFALASDDEELFHAFEHIAYRESHTATFVHWLPSRPPPPALAWLLPCGRPAPSLALIVELRGERVRHYNCKHLTSHGLQFCAHMFAAGRAKPDLVSDPLPAAEGAQGLQRVVGLSFHRTVIDFPGHAVVALTHSGSYLSSQLHDHLTSLAVDLGGDGELRFAEMDCHLNHLEEPHGLHCPALYVFPAGKKEHPVHCPHASELVYLLSCLEAATGKQFPWLEARNEL